MKKKRMFTTVLILITFVIALSLALSSVMISKKPNLSIDQDWTNPIHQIDEYHLEWPMINEDVLAESIVSSKGDFDMVIFESLFESEFEKGCNEIGFSYFEFEYIINNKTMNVMASSNLRIYNDKLISNPTHVYSYQIKVNK